MKKTPYGFTPPHVARAHEAAADPFRPSCIQDKCAGLEHARPCLRECLLRKSEEWRADLFTPERKAICMPYGGKGGGTSGDIYAMLAHTIAGPHVVEIVRAGRKP